MKQQDQSQEENKFTQLCVWQGVFLTEENNITAPSQEEIKEFEEFFKEEMNTRIKYAETVATNPDKDEEGNDVIETGGRSDVLFFVHHDDISHFALSRLNFSIKWWEDVIKYNKNSYLYSQEILDKYPATW